MTGRNAARAFSLVELALVISIIGVLAAIAIPRYGSAQSTFRSRAAARRIAADLVHARTIATTKSISVAIDFAADGTLYTTTIDPANDATLESTVVLSDEPYLSAIDIATLPAGNRITFDGFGKPDSTATLSVLSAQHVTLLTVSGSGRITVSSP